MKKIFIILLLSLFYTFSLSAISTASSLVDLIKDNTNIETSVKGKKLKEFFSGNTLFLSFEGKKKEFRFKEKQYEVYEGSEVIEYGKWKVSGLLKNQIKLKVDDGSKKYYFRKINNKPVIYYYDKFPGSEGSKKIHVEIISSNKIDKTQIFKTKKSTETQKDVSNKTSTKKFDDDKKYKYEEMPKGYAKKLSKLKEKSKQDKIIKKDENIIEIRVKNIFSPSAEYLASEHCEKYKKFAYIFSDGFSGDLKILSPGKKLRGNIYKCSKELLLKDPVSGAKLNWTNFDDASLYKYPEEHLFLYRNKSPIVKKAIKDKKKENPNFWKEGKAKVNTVYYKDEKSIHIKGTAVLTQLNKEGIAIVEAHCKKYNKNYYYFASDFNYGENGSILVYCSESTMSYSEASNTSIIALSNDPTLFTNEKIFTTLGLSGENVNDTQFKVYNSSNLTTFYFFESSHNFMSALELLYRAFDENTEADKLQAQIEYNRESKYSQKEKLASTKALIDGSSIKINAKLSDASLVLSNLGRGYYEQSLPFAYSAAENAYNLFIIIKSTKENVLNSGDLLSGILENLGEVAGLASILPEIPAYTKNMVDTSKLIFNGAKSKKIKDNGNLKKALDELQL